MTFKHLLSASVCFFAAAVPALGQTMNYREFEELFNEPVTLSATGSAQRRSEVPATMNIITAEDIRRSGAITIPQLLSRVAGIDLYTWSKNSADISIRGLNQGAVNRVMVLVNGRENYTDGVGSLFWQFTPVRMDEIRQIEIIKGPSSALYGFNAAAGVINIITYSGMWLHAFSPDFTWLNAARVDRFMLNRTGPVLAGSPFSNADHDRAFTGTSFNSAAVYRFSQLDSFKLMAARGLQLPALSELGGNSFVATRISDPRLPFAIPVLSVSNPFLNPSTTMHYEASYERQIPDLAASGRIAAYHQDVKKLRDPGSPKQLPVFPPVILTTQEEVGDVSLKGLEVEGTGKFLTDWRWTANYAYEKVKNENYVNDKKDYAKTTPRHKVNLSIGWSKGAWETDVFARYQSSADLYQQTAIETYALFKSGPVWAFSQRVAYQFTPQIRSKLVLSSKFADNPLYTEKARALLSLVGNF